LTSSPFGRRNERFVFKPVVEGALRPFPLISSAGRGVVRSALLMGALTSAASAARADAPGPNAPPIQVIAVRSDDAEDQADALTAALRNRVRALRGYSLGDGDYALEVLTLGLKCGEVPDETCQTKIGNQIHADRFVWGSVKRSKNAKQVVAELHLWTRGRPSTKTEFTFSDNLTAPGDDGLRRLVDEALGVLLERHKPPAAVAAARPPAPKAAPATTAPTSPEPPDATTAAGNGAESSGSNLHSTLGWTGVGVGSALIAAGVFSAIRVSSIESDDSVERYRQGFHTDVDSCDQAKAGVHSQVPGAATPTEMQDFCSTAKTFQVLEYVFFGLGAITAGTGIYLLATDSNASAARSKSYFAITPPVGRSGGRVEFGFRF
jgi:hypothetical protein